MAANADLTKIVNKILKTFKDAGSKAKMHALGEYAISIIVRRTRLGYGVRKNLDQRKLLKSMRSHKKSYTKQRTRAQKKGILSNMTAPKKHNLTFSGQLLKSMQIVSKQKQGTLVIGPRGNRFDPYTKKGAKITNEEVGEKVHKMGWIFNRISGPEHKQLLRFYRKTFADLVRKYFGS